MIDIILRYEFMFTKRTGGIGREIEQRKKGDNRRQMDNKGENVQRKLSIFFGYKTIIFY